MTETCNMSNVSYDFILRVETLDSDMEKLYSYFRTLGAFNKTITSSHENMTKQTTSALAQKLSLMKTMEREIVEVGVVQEILKDGDMKVKFPSGCFSFNPAACTSLDAAKSKASGTQQKLTLQHIKYYTL